MIAPATTPGRQLLRTSYMATHTRPQLERFGYLRERGAGKRLDFNFSVSVFVLLGFFLANEISHNLLIAFLMVFVLKSPAAVEPTIAKAPAGGWRNFSLLIRSPFRNHSIAVIAHRNRHRGGNCRGEDPAGHGSKLG